MTKPIPLPLVLFILALASPGPAQQAPSRMDTRSDTVRANGGSWTPIRVAKWGTLAGSTTAMIYGFAENRSADRAYREIEKYCAARPAGCTKQPGRSAYADADLEARRQRIVKRDKKARLALAAGQIGLVASVIMFILDLPKSSAPADIPYHPRPLRFQMGFARVEFGFFVAQ